MTNGKGAALPRPTFTTSAALPRPDAASGTAPPRPLFAEDWARPARRTVVLGLAGVALAGCAGRLLDARPLPADGALGVLLTSRYRAENGLGPVTLDARLSRAAAAQALQMARHDDLSHSIGWGNALPARLAAVDYDWEVTAENIGMGYRTLQAAFDGWVGSAGHRANLLKPGVTQVGFGAAEAPASRSRFYWAMILAAPRIRRDGPVTQTPDVDHGMPG
ncbi:CAP domain-containing protein [Pseudoxanthobacter sp. M-2]|uniref:CAP domain-containing protein n=1 Tax=Pseudoxanthobacter sp. M-2 TaxID=3078754 RepID=UPI0038FCED3A